MFFMKSAPHKNTDILIRTDILKSLLRIKKFSVEFKTKYQFVCPVSRGCRIHRLLLCRGVPPNECPGHDTKQSDGEIPVMQEFWRIQSTHSLLSLPGPLWPGAVAPDKDPIYGLNRANSILMLN